MEDQRDREIVCITSSSEPESESESESDSESDSDSDSDSEYEYESSSDDSEDDDPTFTVLEGAVARFSNLSIKKKPRARVVRENDDESEVDEAELGEEDEKGFEEVLRVLGAEKIKNLKMEQCKVYLRENGLRLTGNKATLVQRVREHIEIVNGGGERKYPVSSFVVNCKGDACTGDVVLFKQKVHDMFNLASLSASGPRRGTRMVAGRIVKESYGAAKQQHTFTIEVLWSKGEKRIPPLHPLLIKGRNLYRLKTLRQEWVDQGERQKILMEKHSRGKHARSDRDKRIRKKGERKIHKENRISKKKATQNGNQSQFDSISVPKPHIQPQQSGFASKPATETHRAGLVAHPGRQATQPHAQHFTMYADCVTIRKDPMQYEYNDQLYNRHSGLHEPHPYNSGTNLYSRDHMNWMRREYPERNTYRRPDSSINNNGAVHKPCRHFAQGRCHFGERCKFSHVVGEEYGTSTRSLH